MLVGTTRREMTKNTVLTGLAGAAAVAGATQGYGAIVAIPLPANVTGNDPAAQTTTARTSRNFDIDGNGTTDIQISYRSFTATSNGSTFAIQQSFVYAYTTGTIAGYAASATSFYAYELSAGISTAGLSFGSSGNYLAHVATHVNSNDYGFWALGDKNYVAFSFLNSKTNQTDYGYFQVETDPYVSAANPGGLKFFSAAYDNTGADIIMGAAPTPVPEPGTLAALAFGGLGAGAVAYRRRKANAPVA